MIWWLGEDVGNAYFFQSDIERMKEIRIISKSGFKMSNIIAVYVMEVGVFKAGVRS